MEPKRVPTTRIERLFEFGQIGIGLGVGMVSSSFKRAFGASDALLTPDRMESIVHRLTKMRGAALKLGQMLSIQDNKMFPPEVEEILRRVQDKAHYMPEKQLKQVLEKEWGSDWNQSFSEFSIVPFAAASIGQVHLATLKNGKQVAVKIQYPGIEESITSDLSNLKALLNFGSLLPKGLYLDNTLRVAALELTNECDYEREAQSMITFSKYLKEYKLDGFAVPHVYTDLSTKKILVSEMMSGVAINQVESYPQSVRDKLGTDLFSLCMAELFQFRFMQTDPNWSNFLYDHDSRKIVLLDFGATRSFPKQFTDKYLRLLHCGSVGDKEGAIKWSQELGFLTGLESQTMNDAHIKSFMTLAQPFSNQIKGKYDFRRASELADTVKSEIPTMLRERLTPPPDESYSLHRKLSGCFLLCTKLGARVDCLKIFQDIYDGYSFSEDT
ncbi:ABC1 family-domain-containing protein [Gorgonomyces haynaldii]|nr:ABC1 family-domain-containing protein [Gorgonomyces haynaldii]